ncbi:MAG: hypothetical protein WED11_13800, partial [Natronospirillum sp.]
MTQGQIDATQDVADPPQNGPMVTADGKPLKASLQLAERRRKVIAFLFVTPLLAYLLISFIIPIGQMMFRSVDNPHVISTLPLTLEALESWDGEGLPDEPVFAALASDLAAAQETRSVGRLAVRLNYEISAARSALTRSARQAGAMEAPFKELFVDAHRVW